MCRHTYQFECMIQFYGAACRCSKDELPSGLEDNLQRYVRFGCDASSILFKGVLRANLRFQACLAMAKEAKHIGTEGKALWQLGLLLHEDGRNREAFIQMQGAIQILSTCDSSLELLELAKCYEGTSLLSECLERQSLWCHLRIRPCICCVAVAAEFCSNAGLCKTAEFLFGHAYSSELEKLGQADVAILNIMTSHANVMAKLGKHPEANEVLKTVLNQR